ncbi:hypothetical protein quinque_001988 [Culex quinquefasciatus]
MMCNVLPLKVAKRITNKLQRSKTKYIVSYSGEKTKVEGDLTTAAVINKRKANLTFKVVDLDVVPILGKQTCVDLKMIQRVNTISSRDDIFKGLGCLRDFEYELDLKPDAAFEIRPTRPIPHKIRDEVKEELDRMVEMGVIVKQEKPTPVGVDVSMDDILIYAGTREELNRNHHKRSPLRQLLQKDVSWQWEHEQQAAFDELMNRLTSLPVLKFYDVNKPNVLSVDCSSHAMGAVLLQDGHSRIILDVQPYAPEILYVRGENVPIADALSRDVNNPTPQKDEDLEVHVVLNVSKAWMKEIVTKTDEDATLRKLINTINTGWPIELEEADVELKPYWNFRDELSTYEGLIFKGDRLLIRKRCGRKR